MLFLFFKKVNKPEWHKWSIQRLFKELNKNYLVIPQESVNQAITVLKPFAYTADDLLYSAEILAAKGLEISIAARIVEFVSNLQLEHVICVLKSDLQVKIAKFKEKQVLAKSHLKAALAKGHLKMPENTKLSYFSPKPNMTAVTLNLEETYPEDKYITWEEALHSGDKMFVYNCRINIPL